MRFLIKMARAYPGQSILMLFAMLFAAIAEGFGFSAMLPLLSTAAGSHPATGQAASTSISENGSTAERLVRGSLESLGVPPTLEVLLLVILSAIILKSWSLSPDSPGSRLLKTKAISALISPDTIRL